MPTRQCFHCKERIEAGAAHDCWTTTEQALTAELSPDLLDAWERLRETAAEFGEQRIYASHSAIMFSRTACYFFVRPKKTVLEVCVFLGRAVKAPQIRRAAPASRAKIVHTIHIRHRDEVESPVTDWLREAYDVSPSLGVTAGKRTRSSAARTSATAKAGKRTASKPAKKTSKKTSKKTPSKRR